MNLASGTFVIYEGRVWRVAGIRRSPQGVARYLIRRTDRSALVEAASTHAMQ